MKLQEFYQKNTTGGFSGAFASNATAYHNGSPAMNEEQKLALRQFNYCQQLCKVMYEVIWSYGHHIHIRDPDKLIENYLQLTRRVCLSVKISFNGS